MGQTFHPVTPIESTPGSAGSWQDVDLDSYVSGLGSNVTGVLLHLVNTSSISDHAISLRKNGSTDDRYRYLMRGTHCWAAIGVDSSHIFEAKLSNITDLSIYIVGYTTTGVEFFTNGVDKSLGSTGSWQDMDCASEAPSADGLIFSISSSTYGYMGLRENGSTDNRYPLTYYHNCFTLMSGCDSSQVCEGKISTTSIDFFLTGYITDGATFNTNRPDRSLGSVVSWQDLTALSSNMCMGFYEVVTSATYQYGLRKNGSSESITKLAYNASNAFVECDSNGVIEGYIQHTSVDFYLIGEASSITAYNESASIAIGMAVSASRLTELTRTASIALGQTITASRLIEFTRTASVALGHTVSATLVSVREAAIAIGHAVTASRSVEWTRTASVAIGQAVSASRLVEWGRTATTAIGHAVTASRSVEWTRTASVKIGQSITASSSRTWTRTASIAMGLGIWANCTAIARVSIKTVKLMAQKSIYFVVRKRDAKSGVSKKDVQIGL